MCTAISWCGKHHYFGRNLDLEYVFDERIVIAPRNFPFSFRFHPTLSKHYAMIGTATVADGYPLYYEATNEVGLSIAGLNFPGNAAYLSPRKDKINLAPFELIPWILGRCANLDEARTVLEQTNLVNTPFSGDWPLSPLHWIIADRNGAVVAEPMADGLHLYDDPIGVLTNNPPFPYHLDHLSAYMALSPRQAKNHFSTTFPLQPYSNGMGAMGLPGDYSSASRFIKAAFVKENSHGGETLESDVVQFFHLLRAVEMPRGSVIMPDGRYEITQYTSCCDSDSCVYYYTTYESSTIHAVAMHTKKRDGCKLEIYPMLRTCQIQLQN